MLMCQHCNESQWLNAKVPITSPVIAIYMGQHMIITLCATGNGVNYKQKHHLFEVDAINNFEYISW